MSDFTIEELKQLLALPKPDIEDFNENGAYDEAGYEYQNASYTQRQLYGKQLLAAHAEIARLTAALTLAESRIAAALEVKPIAYSLAPSLDYVAGHTHAVEDIRARLTESEGA